MVLLSLNENKKSKFPKFYVLDWDQTEPAWHISTLHYIKEYDGLFYEYIKYECSRILMPASFTKDRRNWIRSVSLGPPGLLHCAGCFYPKEMLDEYQD